LQERKHSYVFTMEDQSKVSIPCIIVVSHAKTEVATRTTSVQPESLPHTSAAAAAYHSQRVYLQIQEWKGAEQLQPENTGVGR